jgi:ATP-dependent Clp protease ATP-binding subunit ClpC
VIFEPLEREDIHKIIDIELKHLFKRIEDLGYKIEVNDKAKDFLVEKGWDAQYGARPLKRAIQRYVEDPLAEEIIKHSLAEGDLILVDHSGDEKEELIIKIEKTVKEIARTK